VPTTLPPRGRTRWDGRDGPPPARSQDELRIEAALSVAAGERQHFLEHVKVGAGAAARRAGPKLAVHGERTLDQKRRGKEIKAAMLSRSLCKIDYEVDCAVTELPEQDAAVRLQALERGRRARNSASGLAKDRQAEANELFQFGQTMQRLSTGLL